MTVKLLFDENISYKICRRLDNLFPNSQHINTLNLERSQDIQIWEFRLVPMLQRGNAERSSSLDNKLK